MTEEGSLNNNKRLCACGCGQPTKIYKKKFGKYVNGHQCRSKKIFGRKRHISNGYWTIYKPDYFCSGKNGVLYEHIFVYQEYHKCCILHWMDVHHIDGNPSAEDGNRIENLILMPHKDHAKNHSTKDLSNRYCELCKSKNTTVDKYGFSYWYVYQNGFICRKCFNKNRRYEKKLNNVVKKLNLWKKSSPSQ